MFGTLYTREAFEEFEKPDNDVKKRGKMALENISNNPFRSSQIKKLKGVTNEYRYRVGINRIIYHVNKHDSVCTILGIRPRSRTY